MKRRPGIPNPVLARADAPTLAMSSVHLTAERLRQLLLFEGTLRKLAPPGCTAEQVAKAHAAAVTASGVASCELEAPLALLRRFAANRALAARLTERLGRLEGPALGAEQAAEVRQQLVELDEALRAREDSETRHVLERHAAEILSLFGGP